MVHAGSPNPDATSSIEDLRSSLINAASVLELGLLPHSPDAVVVFVCVRLRVVGDAVGDVVGDCAWLAISGADSTWAGLTSWPVDGTENVEHIPSLMKQS